MPGIFTALNKAHTFFFWLIILILLYPFLTVDFFVTHDGPAHAYNAHLIRQMILGDDELISHFINLKAIPEPNWTGHAIIAVFNFILPAHHAERLLLILFIIIFPWLYRRLVLSVNPDASAASFLIFPFTHSFFLAVGVYNFIIGVAVLSGAMLFLFRYFDPQKFRSYLWLSLITLLLYFSHLLTYSLFLIFLPCYILLERLPSQKLKAAAVTAVKMIIAILPSLVLFYGYVSQKVINQAMITPDPLSRLAEVLWLCYPSITLSETPDKYFGIAVNIVFIILIAVSLFSRNRKLSNTGNAYYRRTSFWLVMSALMFLAYFTIPDQAATGGVIKFRIALFLYMFLILFIATIRLPKFVQLSLIAVMVAWTGLKTYLNRKAIVELDETASRCHALTEKMKPNSIFLPLNFSTNWMNDNISCYTGTRKNIFVLDNYEAGTEHFPLAWKPGMNPVDILGVFNGGPPVCADIRKFEKVTGKKADYVMLLEYNGQEDECGHQITDVLNADYTEIFNDFSRIRLFERK